MLGVLGLSFPGATHQADVGRVLLARGTKCFCPAFSWSTSRDEIKLAQGSQPEVQSMDSSLRIGL